MRAQQQVARLDDAHVGVGLGLAALDQPGRVQHLRDRLVVLVEPQARDLGAVHERAVALHRAEAPRLDALGERAVVPGIGQPDLAAALAVERDALAEEALVALDRQVGDAHVVAGPDARLDLGHVGVDVVAAERARDRDAMVPVADEVQLADAVDGDRRERLAAALRLRDPLPARPQARAGGAEGAVELLRAVDGADDRVERDALEAEVVLGDAAERLDDLLERQDVADVVGLEAQPPPEVGEHPRSPRAGEVVLRVLGGKTGAHRAGPGGRP